MLFGVSDPFNEHLGTEGLQPGLLERGLEPVAQQSVGSGNKRSMSYHSSDDSWQEMGAPEECTTCTIYE